MRHIIIFLFAFFLAVPAWAAKEEAKAPEAKAVEQPQGGFVGPVSGAQAQTVERAKKGSHDTRVALTGHIVSRVAGEKNEYIFKDATGEISVYITPKQFNGNTVTPETRVRLSGKVEKQASDPENASVRVRLLEILK